MIQKSNYHCSILNVKKMEKFDPYKFKLAVVSNFLIFWSSIMKKLCASSEIFVSPYRMFCFLSYKDSLSPECSYKKLSDFCISCNTSISVFELSTAFFLLYHPPPPPRNEVVGGVYWFHHVCSSVDKSYVLSCVS